MRRTLLATAFAILLAPVASTAAWAAPLKVVELFQSQGCSSCPPAIANVNRLGDRADLLTLMFAVTYWDRLGWKDTFASPQFTERQYTYGRVFGDGPYTPEVVINGRHDLVGTDARQLDAAIAQAVLPTDAPALAPMGAGISVGTAPSPFPPGRRGAEIFLVRYDPRVQQVAIGAGENSGITIGHRNIVRALVKLGDWTGAARTYAIPAGGDPAWRSAILVQEKNGGEILAALKL
jgi:hypothetical protein